MKAIYIQSPFDPEKDLEKLNDELKNCHSILWSTEINNIGIHGTIGVKGTLLIVDNYTRKDKLEKLNQIEDFEIKPIPKVEFLKVWDNENKYYKNSDTKERLIENKSYKKKIDRYFIESKFILDWTLIPQVEDLIKRRDTLGLIYGEFENITNDVSLSRVSHKINKISIENNCVEFKIEVLNTHWGQELKCLLDENLPIFTYLRIIKMNNEDKIYTVDIVSEKVN